MIYNFLQNLTKENAVWSKNLLPPHCSFVPASKRVICENFGIDNALRQSDRVFSLDGEWDFYFSKEVLGQFDSETAAWQKINVPDSWESTGVCEYEYLRGSGYKTKGKSAKEPVADAIGVYRTMFSVFDVTKTHTLTFNKVGGTLEVYVNGVAIGYSLFGYGEFDVSGAIHKGNNELVVVVHKHSIIDMLNCGEKQSLSGLVGSVILTIKNTASLRDYNFTVKNDGDALIGELDIAIDGNAENITAKVILFDGQNDIETIDAELENGRAKIIFDKEYKRYTPETPFVYNAYIEVFVNGEEVECTKINLGFITVKVSEDSLLINTVPFKLKGVTYRSFYNADGKLMTIDDYKNELQTVKDFNFNALMVDGVYMPEFYSLCTELGLLVIQKLPVDTTYASQTVKGNKKTVFDSFEAGAFLQEQVIRIYATSRSKACMLMYSFGNESKKYSSVASAIVSLDAQTTLPVLYENGGNGVVQMSAPSLDKLCNQITSIKAPVLITDFVVGKTEAYNKFEPYFNFILSEKQCIGLFVNEFKQIRGLGNEIKPLFDEKITATDIGKLCKYVFRPVKAELSCNRNLSITNTRTFAPSDDVDIMVYLLIGDADTKILEINPSIGAGETRNFEIFLGKIESNMRVLVQYTDVKNGKHIASEYLAVSQEDIMPEKLAELRCKKYEYTVRKTIFDINDISENILPPRAYFVPFSGENLASKGEIYTAGQRSDRFFCLSGEWDFAYFNGIAPVTFDSTSIKWEEIKLPCSWENSGYEPFNFVSGYPFKANLNSFDIAAGKYGNNSVGIYRKIINIGDTSFKYTLSFTRVNGSIELQINGRYVGYSMIGRAEFDVSNYLNIGENEIIVIVKKWTPAAYLDGGDSFLATGIIGEVNLIKSRESGLFDYDVAIKKQGVDYVADLKFKFIGGSGNKVKIELKKDDSVLYESLKVIEDNEVNIGISGNFVGYTAERPELYDLYIKIYENNYVTECTRLNLGFNHTSIVGDVAYYNDVPLKLRGITYNPVYDSKGSLLTNDDIKRDLSLIKEYGFNTIQPLHYVSAEFVQYCKTIGLYILPRLDVNTKGTEKINAKKRNAVVANPKFEKLINATVEYAYARDKESVNIIFYQFVEYGDQYCIEKAMEMLRTKTDKPILAFGDKGDAISACYPSINGVLDLINEAMEKKPVFFTKYASAQGIGCATMHEYEDLISNSPCCIGGCVAHFVDDFVNDSGNKAVGIFTYDRKPYPSAESIKYLYRPLKSELVSGHDAIEIVNTRKFIPAKDLYAEICIIRDGKEISRTRTKIDIPPCSSQKYDVKYDADSVKGDMYINVEYHDVVTGELKYVEQHQLNYDIPKIELPSSSNPLIVTEICNYVDIKFECGSVRFNKKLGCITGYNLMGKEILKPESLTKGVNCFVNNIYRPFVRNLQGKYPKYTSEVRDFLCEYVDEATMSQMHVNIENIISLNEKECFIVQDKYIINSNGAIEVFSVITPLKRGLPVMDCFGKQLRLHNSFGNITYYGNGEGVNYIDMCEHTKVGIYNFGVDKTFALLSTIQESGNRTNVSYAVARDNEGDGIMLITKKIPYQLRVSPYSDKEIYDSYKSGKKPSQSAVYIDINAFVSGIGTNNDGKPLPQYVICASEHILHFTLVPVWKK